MKLFKDLEGKAAKYSNTVTDQAGKKINTEFILERNSPIEKLEEFKDIANDFLQLLNETI